MKRPSDDELWEQACDTIAKNYGGVDKIPDEADGEADQQYEYLQHYWDNIEDD